jgi:hypothetical protein
MEGTPFWPQAAQILLMSGMNTPLENPLDALQRRLEFKVSGFKFKVQGMHV